MRDAKTRTELEQRIEQLRPWRYNHTHEDIVITSNAPLAAAMYDSHGRDSVRHIVGVLLQDKNPAELRALDLGCLEGHYTDILCSMGFQEVVAIDLSEEHIQRARFLLKELKGYTNITIVQGNVTDDRLMESLGTFDVILFHGLLYHLKDPLRMFDIIEHLVPTHGNLSMLLMTQYKGSYETIISPQPLAELQIKPPRKVVQGHGADGVLFNPSDGSAFERCSFRLNPSAVYHVLRLYNYQEVISYDTPAGAIRGFSSNLVVSKQPQPHLLEALQRQVPVHGVRFYQWDGNSVDSYHFRQRMDARAARFGKRKISRLFEQFKNLQRRSLRKQIIRLVMKLPGMRTPPDIFQH